MALTKSEVVRRTASLKCGPWCWPDAGTREYEAALALVADGPPPLRPGDVPLLTVDARGIGASLWRLRFGNPECTAGVARLEGTAQSAWRNASLAVPRSLPLLWSDVGALAQQPIHAEHVAQRLLRDGAAPPAKELTGTSFGLSFVLALTSLVIRRPVPADIVASAEVEVDGTVAPVDGLEAKIAVVEHCAPRLRRLLVAAPQEVDAGDYVRRMEIVPVRSAAEAIRIVFGDEAFTTCLGEYGRNPQKRAAVIDFLFRHTMVSTRRPYIDWGPIARAAGVAVDAWAGLDREQRWRLAVAHGIADRHAGGRAPIPLPDAEQMLRFPRPLRVALVAQLIQQCHDAGSPTRNEIEPYLDDPQAFVPLDECFSQQLAAWGARARLLAVTGNPAEAMAIQERLTHAWVERMEYSQPTFPLAEWLRLSGALAAVPQGCTRTAAEAAFERANVMRDQLTARTGFEPQSAAYVDLARARAGVMMCGGPTGPVQVPPSHLEEWLAELGRIAADRVFAPAHVRMAAQRLRIAASEALDDGDTIALAEKDLVEAEAGDDGELNRAARRANILVQLDRALRRGDANAAMTTVAALEATDPGPVGHLLAVADPPAGAAEYVAAYYPY